MYTVPKNKCGPGSENEPNSACSGEECVTEENKTYCPCGCVNKDSSSTDQTCANLNWIVISKIGKHLNVPKQPKDLVTDCNNNSDCTLKHGSRCGVVSTNSDNICNAKGTAIPNRCNYNYCQFDGFDENTKTWTSPQKCNSHLDCVSSGNVSDGCVCEDVTLDRYCDKCDCRNNGTWKNSICRCPKRTYGEKCELTGCHIENGDCVQKDLGRDGTNACIDGKCIFTSKKNHNIGTCDELWRSGALVYCHPGYVQKVFQGKTDTTCEIKCVPLHDQ